MGAKKDALLSNEKHKKKATKEADSLFSKSKLKKIVEQAYIKVKKEEKPKDEKGKDDDEEDGKGKDGKEGKEGKDGKGKLETKFATTTRTIGLRQLPLCEARHMLLKIMQGSLFHRR